MKEITTHGDQYGKWYEVKGTDGYYSKYYMSVDTFDESEEDKIGSITKGRLAREKAIERNKRIDSILG